MINEPNIIIFWISCSFDNIFFWVLISPVKKPYLSGLFTESTAYYERATSLKPLSIEAHFGYVYPASALGNWNLVKNHYLIILEIDPQNFFEEVNEICSNLIIKEKPTKQENNILQVLHWLRKSIQEGNNKDKFIDLWIAFEFLISGTKPEKLFIKDEIAELNKFST